ncbi:MAG: response regulator [bacterium]
MKTILIIDDEKRIRAVYKAILLKEGYQVLEASNAVEGRDKIKLGDVNLVLLDIKMAEIGGNVLYEVIRSFHKEVMVIVSSVLPIIEQMKMVPSAFDYHDKADGNDILLRKVEKAFCQEDPKSYKYGGT